MCVAKWRPNLFRLGAKLCCVEDCSENYNSALRTQPAPGINKFMTSDCRSKCVMVNMPDAKKVHSNCQLDNWVQDCIYGYLQQHVDLVELWTREGSSCRPVETYADYMQSLNIGLPIYDEVVVIAEGAEGFERYANIIDLEFWDTIDKCRPQPVNWKPTRFMAPPCRAIDAQVVNSSEQSPKRRRTWFLQATLTNIGLHCMSFCMRPACPCLVA